MSTKRRVNRSSRRSKRGGGSRVPTDFKQMSGPTAFCNNLNQTHMMKLSELFPVTTNGSGVAAGVLVSDPSSSGVNFSNYGSISALWKEIRIVGFNVRVVPADVKVTGTASPFCCSFSNTSTATPTSATSILDNAGSAMMSFNSTSVKGLLMSHRWPKTLTYAGVTTPAPSSLTAGCPGSFGWYSDGHTVSTTIVWIYLEAIYQLRTRA